MRNTLEELNINYSIEEEAEEATESIDNIDVAENQPAANDDGVELIEELQQSLRRQQELEAEVKSLQEKLSVCYTKETRYSDRLAKANSKITMLTESNSSLSQKQTELTNENVRLTDISKKLTEQVNSLSDSLNAQKEEVSSLSTILEGYRSRYTELQKQFRDTTSTRKTLDENLNMKSVEVSRLTEAYNKLKESSESKLQEEITKATSLEKANKSLTEELMDLKKDSQIYKSQSTAKLDKAQKLVEKYKSIAKTAVDKYIVSMATKIGVSPSDIKCRLTESYSFQDIDDVIDNLQQYKLNLNSLPFTTIAEKKPVRMQIKESKTILSDKTSYNVDDDIDDSLLTFTK